MTWLSGIFVYLLVWWVMLFTVLPWGNAPPETPQPGRSMGAPANPRLKQKLIATTLVAGLTWLAIFALIESNLISFREMVKDMPD